MKSFDCKTLFTQGITCLEREEYLGAEEFFRKALDLSPGSQETVLNLGYALDMQGRFEDALDCYEKVLAVSPDNANARYNRATHRLRAGNLLEGFEDYEWRHASVAGRPYLQPRWDGSDLRERTILVYCEQGLGDAIQFCRYIPFLAEQGAKVVVEVQPPLLSLLSQLAGVSKVVPVSSIPPLTDVYIPLLSLPHMFKTRLETIPNNVPYLAPTVDSVDRWKNRIAAASSSGFRIGIAWAGKSKPYPYRTCPPEFLLPLNDVAGVEFFSLQIDTSNTSGLPSAFNDKLTDLTAEIDDFHDTAALVANLDLVITVDTALAHLAGAMGKPVWLMLPALSDWRWLEKRDDSPWYPTMRLFRQPEPGDWGSVIQQIKAALRDELAIKGLTTASDADFLENIFEKAISSIKNALPEDAIMLLEPLLREHSEEPAIWFNLGWAYQAKDLLIEARNCYQQSLRLEPENATAWHALGNIHYRKNAFAAAEECLRKAHQKRPESVEILFDLGASLVEQGKNEEAFVCCDKILAIEPDNSLAIYNKSYLQLRGGDFLNGFKNFEERLRIGKFNIDSRIYSQPRWDGSPLDGKSILVFGEQGMGDVIQFSRYLPMIAELGGVITLEVDPPLAPLFKAFPGVSRIVLKSLTPPETDCYIQSLSLPFLFGTTTETVPANVPYIVPDAEKTARWKKILGAESGFRVGLVWRGNPRNPIDQKRSASLSAFLPLFNIPGVQFYSLQVGCGREETESYSESISLIDHTDRLSDFSETAALIANLDIVIGVDTSVMHLAGAIGKPAWILVPISGDWRWIEGRTDSPWYPTMRIFWQKRYGDWDDVVSQIKGEMENFLKSGKSSAGSFDIEGCYNLGVKLKEDSDLTGAEQCFLRIVECAPELPDPQHALGVVLQLQGRFQEAIPHYRMAIAADPAFVQARYNLANALLSTGDQYGAATELRLILKIDPVHGNSHWMLGMLLLRQGDYKAGWQEYEWRWRATNYKYRFPDLASPQWDGSRFSGRTLLIHMEQGRGDMIQFVRYVPLAAALGGRIIVGAIPELLSLIETVEGVSSVVKLGNQLPHFDLHIPLLSLPAVLGTTLESIPAQVPYIHSDRQKVDEWRKILSADKKLKVGLAWQGSVEHRDDANRSCPLSIFQNLFDLAGASFYSLQVGAGREQLQRLDPAFTVIDYTERFHDFSDTAAFIENLDLVISVDTAVAHLAGALDKPVWVLLQFVSEWRWLLEREDSPWYPSMFLFRQKRDGDWEDVFGKVRIKLAATLEGKINSGHEATANIADLCRTGAILDEQGKHEEAIDCYREALWIYPDNLLALFNMGNSFVSLGRQKEAKACYERVIELNPVFIPPYLCLGEICKNLRQLEQAAKYYERVLEIDASSIDAMRGVADVCLAKEKFEEAIEWYQRALDREPLSAELLNLLGNVYHITGRSPKAEEYYRRALELAPGKVNVINNLGVVLVAQRRLDEAIKVYEQLLEADPSYADGHWNMASALLASGRFREGWREYEWRFRKTDSTPSRNFDKPRWDGSALDGKTILLHCEQGFGDTLQFIRYAPMVAERGCNVIVECQSEALKRIIAYANGVDRVIVAGEPLPDFECHFPLLSLPLLFNTEMSTIPAEVPYLFADRKDIEAWRQRIKPGSGVFRVGLAWHGRQGQILNRKRSCPLDMFAQFAEIPNIEFYSLQVGETPEQKITFDAAFPLIDLTENISDFADTAALMANLNLVITIDTSVAHLAGALGVPTWVMLPFASDWRWHHSRDDSPWYPSMRLFRQPLAGDWHSVISALSGALRRVTRTMQSGPEASSGKPPVSVIPGPFSPVGREGLEANSIRSRGKNICRRRKLRVGIAWSCRQDSPINLYRACPFSALSPLFQIPDVVFYSLQVDHNDVEAKNESQLIDITPHIKDFADTAALMANLDLVITVDTVIPHLAASTGRPTWLMLPYIHEWRWQQHHKGTPWYPGLKIFRQSDIGNWDYVVSEISVKLMQLTGNLAGKKSVVAPSQNSAEQQRLLSQLDKYRQVMEERPLSPDSLLDVGASLALLLRFEEAVELFRKVIDIDPGHVSGHLNLAYSLLALGKYEEGFSHFEWRLKKIPEGMLPPWPMLTKENFGTHSSGTILLVHAEQGFGDFIQFCRFLPLIANSGYKIVLSCQPTLARLARSLSDDFRVIPHGDVLPICELQMLLLSAPWLLGVTLEKLPHPIPYLFSDPVMVKKFYDLIVRKETPLQ